jgi:hypothetical protein
VHSKCTYIHAHVNTNYTHLEEPLDSFLNFCQSWFGLAQFKHFPDVYF